VIYPGAYHAWTVPEVATARFYPEFVSTKKCPLILFGPNGPAFSSTVKQRRLMQAPSRHACVRLPDIRWDMIQWFARNRSLKRCGFFSETSDLSARSSREEVARRSE
jgi:hypothetical protein